MPTLYVAERDDADHVAWVWKKDATDRFARPVTNDTVAARIRDSDEVYGASRSEVDAWLRSMARRS